MFGGSGADVMYGNGGADFMDGDSGNDSVLGGAGDDTQVAGDQGNDFVSGGGGRNNVWGGDDDDVLVGGSGDENLYGELGNDTVSGGGGNDVIWGGGGTGADALNGGNGNDTIYGEAGDDTLTGGPGVDPLHGGAGTQDVCDPGSGADPTPTECEAVAAEGTLRFVLRWTTQVDMDLWVTEPGGNRIWYQNPSSPSGGQLDVDVQCSGNGGLENIVWTSGDHPVDGTYQYKVNEYQQCGDGPASWFLEVWVGSTRVRSESGTGTQSPRTISINV